MPPVMDFRRTAAAALLLPLVGVRALVSPAAGVQAPLSEAPTATLLPFLGLVDPPSVTRKGGLGQARRWQLVYRERLDLCDSDLPTVFAVSDGVTVESGCEDLHMSPEICRRLLRDVIGSVRLVESNNGYRSYDLYVAELAAARSEKVAIEILDTEDAATTREVRARRLLAKTLGDLPLYGVFPVFEIDVFKESTFLLMPAADGSLRESGRMRLLDFVVMGLDVLRGLICIDMAGLAHRTLSESNILRKRDRWFVSDFSGSAKHGDMNVHEVASDAYVLFSIIQDKLRKVVVDEPMRPELVALLSTFDDRTDLTALEAFRQLEYFAFANGLPVRAPQALCPPDALQADPHTSKIFAPRKREDGEPLYPHLYEKYVKPWHSELAESVEEP